MAQLKNNNTKEQCCYLLLLCKIRHNLPGTVCREKRALDCCLGPLTRKR